MLLYITKKKHAINVEVKERFLKRHLELPSHGESPQKGFHIDKCRCFINGIIYKTIYRVTRDCIYAYLISERHLELPIVEKKNIQGH